jgi:hypothetical protein
MMKLTHDECWDGNMYYFILVDIILTFMDYEYWSNLSVKKSVTPMALVNAGCPQLVRVPVNEDAIIAGMESEPGEAHALSQVNWDRPNLGS